jgi:hypothetical protein
VSSRPDLKKKKKIEEVKDFKSRVSRQKTEWVNLETKQFKPPVWRAERKNNEDKSLNSIKEQWDTV